jgi:hypothetical protein
LFIEIPPLHKKLRSAQGWCKNKIKFLRGEVKMKQSMIAIYLLRDKLHK